MGKYYYLIPVTILCILATIESTGFEVHDFANYYFGGLFINSGNFDEWLYFPYNFNKAISDIGFQDIYVAYAPNTPFLALFFAPFALIPLGISKIVFNILGIALIITSLARLTSFYKIKPVYFFILPLVFFTPFRNNILFGQVYFLLFFLLTECWIAYERAKHQRVAIFLSIAIMLKVFPILLVLIFLYRKQFKLIFQVGFCCAILALCTIIFTGFDIWLFFMNDVLPRASVGEISGAFVDNYQSVFMFLKRLFIYDGTLNPDGLNKPVLFHIILFALKLLLLTIGYYLTRNVKDNLWVFSYWIFCSIILTSYGSTYGLILLLFPYFSVIQSKLSHSHKLAFIAILMMVNNIPTGFLSQLIFPFSYLRLILFIAAFTIALFIYFRQSEWKTSLIIITIPVLLAALFFESPTIKSKPLLGKNSPLLIYDYILADGKITYKFWNFDGEDTGVISYKYEIAPRVLTDIELFTTKKELTFEKGNIRKPMIHDDKIVIYLSDYGRGFGFYTLRWIELKSLQSE